MINRYASTVFFFSLALALASAGLIAACGSSGGGGADGSTAGPDAAVASSLTYNNFGKPFMDKYCVSCHAPGAATRFAPDLDTLSRVKASAARVDARSGMGSTMPPSDPRLTAAERAKLSEWIAAGAP